MKPAVVIIGAGHAGVQAAASLRDEGFDGAITLIEGQDGLPYQRPPLSKAFLKGETSLERIILRSEQFYREQKIDLRPNSFVQTIEPAERKVKLKSGHSLAYSKLILATGARSRELSVEGHHLAGVMALRDVKDAEAIKTALQTAQDIVVIGAGFIGLEFATVAAAQGAKVTVVEMQHRVMARAISSKMSAAFLAKHQNLGVSFKFGVGLQRCVGSKGHVTSVELTDGSSIKAKLVVVGIGVLAKDRLAVQAGLDVNNGILVDETLKSSNPDIFAIGDNNAHPNAYFGDRLRLESVQNAVDQGKHVATIITGKSQPYKALPWFWSDQADYKLQIVGVAQSISEQIIRGDAASGAFSIFGFSNGKLSAVESLNRPGDHMVARRLIEGEISLTPTQAADASFDLKGLLTKPTA
jgi:3-phenylpropionate/trans-cinnamate dioxygenase ferredoxin reductase component